MCSAVTNAFSAGNPELDVDQFTITETGEDDAVGAAAEQALEDGAALGALNGESISTEAASVNHEDL